MSYGNSGGAGGQGKAAGGGGCVFLIVLLVGGYLILSGMGGQMQPLDGDGANANGPMDIIGDEAAGEGQTAEGPMEQHPDSDDWDMSDAGSTADSATRTEAANTNNNRTENGDWSIEQVDQSGSDDVELRLNNQSEDRASSADGDWSIENVEGSGDSNTTTNGDWSAEEVDINNGGN